LKIVYWQSEMDRDGGGQSPSIVPEYVFYTMVVHMEFVADKAALG